MTIPKDKAAQVYTRIESALYLYFRMITGFSIDLDTGVSVSMAEMHMIRRVFEAGETTVTELARQAVVSKAAVSLLLTRLVKKGLIQKCPHTENRSKVSVTTTPEGEKFAKWLEELHKRNNEPFLSYLAGLNDEDFAVVSEFSRQFKSWLQVYGEEQL